MKRIVAIAALVGAAQVWAFDVPLGTDKFKLNVGGFFYGAAHFDDNGAAPRPWLSVVTTSAAPATFFEPFASRLNITAETTLMGSNTDVDTDRPRGKGVLELDWLPAGVAPPNAGPRIRLAYAQVLFPNIGTVAIGQMWSLVGAGGPDTYNINWFLRQGNPWARVPGLQLSSTFADLVTVSVGAVGETVGGFGGTAAIVDPTVPAYTVIEGRAPAGEARVSVQILQKGYVAAMGGFGRLDVGPASGVGRPVSTMRYLVGADFNAPVGGWGTVSGKVFKSAGGGYGTGIGQPVVIDAALAATAVPAWGGFLSAKLEKLQPVVLAAYVGVDDPDDAVAGLNVPLQMNLTFGGHATYNFTPGAQLALEIMRVSTTRNVAGTATVFSDDRFSLIARYLF